MRTMKHWALAAAAAAAWALAGCGGGGSSSSGGPTGTTDPPPPANLTAMFAAAQTASDNAVAAGEAATAAVKSATDSAKMLTTTEVGGDSMKAMMNAQAILDARDDAAQAVMDAEAALAAAEKAQMDAMDVADGHPQKAALMAAADAAVEAAEEQVMMAKAARDGTMLKNAVAEVEGSNKKGTPRSIANMVGSDIAAALATGATRVGTRIAYGTDAPAATVPAALKHVANDAQGMTWAMIVGEDDIMKMRLGTIDTTGALTAGNEEVSVASLEGMTAADVTSTTLTDGTIDADGGTTPGSYMGILGAVVCLGGSDGCKVTDGKLGAGWYFSPASPMAYYQSQKDDPATPADESLLYEAEVLYASYGHWLTSTGDPLEWTVNTFANFAGTNAADVTTVGNDTNNLTNTATYSGMAAGMSVRTMGSGDSKTTDSGAFTADVMLTANFGATPTVRGTIDNFMGDAVGSGWSVNLESATLGTTSNDGIATGTGRDGVWSATAYGTDSAARPAGIIGGFTAHFTDGDAAGAFAARIDE